jgi:hypothetical protein
MTNLLKYCKIIILFQIVVLEGVQIQEGQVDVLYVGTDQGNVIKMVNLAGKNSTWNVTNDLDSDPMHQVAIFQVSKVTF